MHTDAEATTTAVLQSTTQRSPERRSQTESVHLFIKKSIGSAAYHAQRILFFELVALDDEIILSVPDTGFPTLHLWDGFFRDIFRDPPLDGKGWSGFTRDMHQCEGAFDWHEQTLIPNPKEYLDDILQYKDKKFQFSKTPEVYPLIVELLTYAVENGKAVMIDFG